MVACTRLAFIRKDDEIYTEKMCIIPVCPNGISNKPLESSKLTTE
jgi:hypothetical protein